MNIRLNYCKQINKLQRKTKRKVYTKKTTLYYIRGQKHSSTSVRRIRTPRQSNISDSKSWLDRHLRSLWECVAKSNHNQMTIGQYDAFLKGTHNPLSSIYEFSIWLISHFFHYRAPFPILILTFFWIGNCGGINCVQKMILT